MPIINAKIVQYKLQKSEYSNHLELFLEFEGQYGVQQSIYLYNTIYYSNFLTERSHQDIQLKDLEVLEYIFQMFNIERLEQLQSLPVRLHICDKIMIGMGNFIKDQWLYDRDLRNIKLE